MPSIYGLQHMCTVNNIHCINDDCALCLSVHPHCAHNSSHNTTSYKGCASAKKYIIRMNEYQVICHMTSIT